jgi:hypothetical protein
MPESELSRVTIPTPPRSRGRKLAIFAGLLLLMLACIAGSYFYVTIAARNSLRAALAETDRLDPGWHIPELEAKRTVIPDEQNSAINCINAKSLQPPQWPLWNSPQAVQKEGLSEDDARDFDSKLASLKPPELLDQVQAKMLRKEVDRAKKSLQELYKIADKPRGRYPITYTKDYIGTLLPHTQNTRWLANLLAYDAILRAQEEDMAGACKACRCLIYCQRAIGDEPTFISTLVRIAIRQIALKKIERTLAQGQPNDAMLTGLQQVLEEEAREPLFLIGARGERGMADGFLAAVQNGEVKMSWRQLRGMSLGSGTGTVNEVFEELRFRIAPGSLSSDRAALLRFENQIVELAKLPVDEQFARFKSLELDARKLPLAARVLAPAYEKLISAHQRDQASLRCAILLLAAERFRLAHKRWPKDLSELVPAYIARVQLDPFDGQPLRLRPFADGIAIYSVSYDGQDNGGNLSDNPMAKGTDWGLRLWDVAKRRQPPASSSASAGR